MDQFPRISRSAPRLKQEGIGYNVELRPYDITFRDVPIGQIINTHYDQRRIPQGVKTPTWKVVLFKKDGVKMMTKVENTDFDKVKAYLRENYKKVLEIAGHVPG